MVVSIYNRATFIKSAYKVSQLPDDTGYEVAFAGRSNAGKSSALNTLANIKRLARISKTPGRTQLINLFMVKDAEHRLVDLPGYGYAKVPEQMKLDWQKHLAHYLEVRRSLKGLILLMDIRHPLMASDRSMLQWALHNTLKVHLVLTKADKLSFSQSKLVLMKVQQDSLFIQHQNLLSVQTFSSLKKQGVSELALVLDRWLEL
jgi:GTP-binding protein